MSDSPTTTTVIDLVRAGDWLIKKYNYKSPRQWSRLVAAVSGLLGTHYTHHEDARYIRGVIDLLSIVIRTQWPSFTVLGFRVERVNAEPMVFLPTAWDIELVELCARSLVYSVMKYIDESSPHLQFSGLRSILLNQIDVGFDSLFRTYVRFHEIKPFEEFRVPWSL